MLEELIQEAGTLIVFLAGISYIAVGIYLLQTASRQSSAPSFFLGWALLCNGFSFGLSEIPFVAGTDQFLEPLSFISRICSAACSVAIAPFVWLSLESLREYRVSRRRVSLGLIDPVLSNRFFLIGFYAALASLTYFIYIPMYIVYELHGVWSGWLDLGLGLVEVVSVVALLLSFSTPPFYRKWIGASAAGTPKS